jgi:uncharacterized protein YgbK (DUF1537 family)
MPVLLGAVADDFTGATDLANILVSRGMHTVQTIGMPAGDIELGDAEAVVVALKSRTAPVEEAVSLSLAAAAWLRAKGARQLFWKYCSTFDSTPRGNIGPVADALLELSGGGLALVCPAFPANGRTVYQGHLFVGDRLLSESSMKDHPLTPMRDSDLRRLMAAQSRHKVGLVPWPVVQRGPETIAAAFEALRAAGHAYAVVDAIADENLLSVGTAAASHALVTGGSAVAMGLPENFRRQGLLGPPVPPELPTCRGRAVVLAGSCSMATRGQIAAFTRTHPALKLDADRLAAGEPVVAEALEWAARQPTEEPILIYSSADPDEVRAIQERHGRERTGALIEDALSALARALVERGARRLIVAGGETSGAVVSALGVKALRIGPEIDPGVPWTETLGEPHLALALKSGNFGSEVFFLKAFGMLP